jgi:hypothetical protein
LSQSRLSRLAYVDIWKDLVGFRQVFGVAENRLSGAEARLGSVVIAAANLPLWIMQTNAGPPSTASWSRRECRRNCISSHSGRWQQMSGGRGASPAISVCP